MVKSRLFTIVTLNVGENASEFDVLLKKLSKSSLHDSAITKLKLCRNLQNNFLKFGEKVAPKRNVRRMPSPDHPAPRSSAALRGPHPRAALPVAPPQSRAWARRFRSCPARAAASGWHQKSAGGHQRDKVEPTLFLAQR